MSFVFFFKQKTAYEMRISDWSSDVCSSDLIDLPHDPLDVVAGTHRHCRLGDDHGKASDSARDLLSGGMDVSQVRMAITPAGRRAHRDEYRIGILHPFGQIGRELQPPGGDVARHQMFKARDRKSTRLNSSH